MIENKLSYDMSEWSKNKIVIEIAKNDRILGFVDMKTDKVYLDQEMKKPILCSCDDETHFYSNGDKIYCPKCKKTYQIIYDYEDNQKAKKEMEEEYRAWCQEEIAKFEAEK